MKEIAKDVGHWIREAFNTFCEWIAEAIAILLFVLLLFTTLYIALNTSCAVEGPEQPTVCIFTDSNRFIDKLTE